MSTVFNNSLLNFINIIIYMSDIFLVNYKPCYVKSHKSKNYTTKIQFVSPTPTNSTLNFSLNYF